MNVHGPEGQEAMRAENAALRSAVSAALKRVDECEKHCEAARGVLRLREVQAQAYDDLRAILGTAAGYEGES